MKSVLKDIVENLLKTFGPDEFTYFMEGEFREPFKNKYDSKEIGIIKGHIDSLRLDVKCSGEYGGEDMGSDYWSVYKFTLDDVSVYVKFQGFYQSYNGAEFSEWFFVEPKEKVVIGFDRVE